MRKVVDIRAGESAHYPVFVGDDAGVFFETVWRPSWSHAVIIADHNTHRLFADAVRLALRPRAPQITDLAFPPGETHKTRQTKAALEDSMLDAGIDRSACVVGLGGGIALDVAGFVAATYLRGVPVVHVATSLLAQVDASVGGKTAVNTRHGKNLVGAFHAPSAVLLPTGWLSSLPEDELRNGLSEAVKTAVVGDAALFAQLEQFAAVAPASRACLPTPLIEQCVRVKASIVSNDERESGLRRILNYGHTVGHAVETASAHAISHGTSVALGMLVEAHLAECLTGFPRQDRARLDQIVHALRLADCRPPAFEDVAAAMTADKKSSEGLVRCALPRRIGEMDAADGHYARPVPLAALRVAWDSVMCANRRAPGLGGQCI